MDIDTGVIAAEEDKQAVDISPMSGLARAQRRLMLAFLFKIIAYVLIGVSVIATGDNDSILVNIEMCVWLALTLNLLVQIYCFVSIARPEQAIGLLYVLACVFLPPVGLFMIWSLSRRVTKYFKKNGVRVGLLGPDLNTI